MVKINKWHENFMLEVQLLYLIRPKDINFFQLNRYDRFGEQRYCGQFGHKLNYPPFKANLADSQLGNRRTIAFDLSYISK